MNFLELYARLKMQTSIMQFVIMLAMLQVNLYSDFWFSLVPTSTTLFYFCISLGAYELTVKDVEIDQISPRERSDSQKRLQFVKICLDWLLMLISIVTVFLTSINLVLAYVSINV